MSKSVKDFSKLPGIIVPPPTINQLEVGVSREKEQLKLDAVDAIANRFKLKGKKSTQEDIKFVSEVIEKAQGK